MNELSYNVNNNVLIFNGLDQNYAIRCFNTYDKEKINLGSDIHPVFIDVNDLSILNLKKIEIDNANKHQNIAILVNLRITQIKVNAELAGYTSVSNQLYKDRQNLNITKQNFNTAIDDAITRICCSGSNFIIEKHEQDEKLHISYYDHKIDIISVLEIIGEGGRGVVNKIYTFGHEQFEALKISKSIDNKQLHREFSVLQNLHQQKESVHFQTVYKIANIFGKTVMIGKLYVDNLSSLLMQFDPKVMQSDPKIKQTKLKCCYELCLALKSLFANGYTHGDLKPQNILLTQQNKTVLADFEDAWHKQERFNKLLTTMQSYKTFSDFLKNELDIIRRGYTPGYLHQSYMDEIVACCEEIYQHQHDDSKLQELEQKLHNFDQKRDVFAMGAVIVNILTGYDMYTVNAQPVPRDADVNLCAVSVILKYDDCIRYLILSLLEYPEDDTFPTIDMLLSATEEACKKLS